MPENGALVPLERGLVDLLQRRPNYPTFDVESKASDTYSHLGAYWSILRKRRGTILTVASVLVTLVTVYSFKVTPVYQATGRLEVEGETPEFRSVDQYERSIPADATFLQTQVDVLASENLAWRTIEQLKLDTNPKFNSRQQEPPAVAQARLIRTFEEDLHVELARDSRMLEVSFDSTDPALAASAANALMNNYIEYNFKTKYDATREASGWMEQQLDELKAKVEKSQQALVDYERQNAIVNISDKENVVEQRFGSLSQDLTAAESDLAGKQSIFELVKANPSKVAMLAQNDLLQKLEEKYVDVKTEYVSVLAQYGPKAPKVVRLEDQVNVIQSLISQERERTVERVRRDYDAAVGRQKILAAKVARERIDVGRLNQLLIQENILKHEFQTNQDLYESLLKRLKDATVSAGLRATNTHIVDKALVPAIPVRPKKLLNIAIGLMMGLILGMTLAFLQEGLDNSIKSVEDVEQLVSAPTLAVIPAAGSIRPRTSWLGGTKQEAVSQNEAVALAVAKQPASALAESYRSLRTSILLSTAPKPPQALLITSAQPFEGKTCTSLNLGTALAQRGGQVLIIDADLRKPGIGPALGLADARGLSGFLTGAHGLEEVIRRVDSVPNLSVIVSGQRPPNPAELLSSTTMERLLGDLRQRFDHLVIDSPPLLMVTDATVLSKFVDGVVLVVESGATQRKAVLRAHKVLENAGTKILGVVVNKMDLRNDSYYAYGYKAYYHSYYHDEGPGPEKASPGAERGSASGPTSLPKG